MRAKFNIFGAKEIIDVRGEPDNCFYQARWEGYRRELDPVDGSTWEPAKNLVDDEAHIDQFWSSNPHHT